MAAGGGRAPTELLAAYNERDWDRFRAQLAPDCVYEEIAKPSRRVTGREEIEQVFRGWAAAVPEARATVKAEVSGADGLAVEVEWLGAEQAPFGDFAPSGHPPVARGAIFFFLRDDGLIAEFRHFYDSLVLYQVLGIQPA